MHDANAKYGRASCKAPRRTARIAGDQGRHTDAYQCDLAERLAFIAARFVFNQILIPREHRDLVEGTHCSRLHIAQELIKIVRRGSVPKDDSWKAPGCVLVLNHQAIARIVPEGTFKEPAPCPCQAPWRLIVWVDGDERGEVDTERLRDRVHTRCALITGNDRLCDPKIHRRRHVVPPERFCRDMFDSQMPAVESRIRVRIILWRPSRTTRSAASTTRLGVDHACLNRNYERQTQFQHDSSRSQ